MIVLLLNLSAYFPHILTANMLATCPAMAKQIIVERGKLSVRII